MLMNHWNLSGMILQEFSLQFTDQKKIAEGTKSLEVHQATIF